MNRTTTLITDEERTLANEQDSVEEYRQERERAEDSDILSGLREMDGSGGITWRVYRVGDVDEDKNGWVGDVPRESLSMQHLANRYGTGTYRVEGTNSQGRYVARRTVKVAADAKRTDANTIVRTEGKSFDIDDWERRQDARDERRRKERNELLAIVIPAAAPIVAAIMGRQGPDMTALIAALKPPDPLQMIAALKALQPQVDQQQPTAMDAAFRLIDKLRDMAPSEAGTSWLDVAKEGVRTLGPVLGPALEGALTRASSAGPATTAGGAIAAPHPAGSLSTAPSVASTVSTGESSVNIGQALILGPWIKTQLEMAIQKAIRGSDPGLIAERILDDIPAGVDVQELIQFIKREDWWTQLQRFDSRVSAHSAWFVNMRSAMLEFVGQETDTGKSTMQVKAIEEKPETGMDRPTGEPPKLGA